MQVYHRACTIGTVSTVSVTALVQRAGQVGFGMISVLSTLMGTVSKVNMAYMMHIAGMRETE